MKKLLAVLVALVCGLAQAANPYCYWSGLGGDNRWDTADNWATDEALTNPAGRCPTVSDIPYFVPGSYQNHELTVIVPDGATCNKIYMKGDTVPVKLKLVGEPLPGKSRAVLANASYLYFMGSYGMTLEVKDIEFSGQTWGNMLSLSNTHVVMKNCVCPIGSQDFKLAGGKDSSCTFIDSTFTGIKALTRYAAGADFALTVSNTTIECSSTITFSGSRAKTEVVDSDITLASTLLVGASGDTDHKASFVNSHIRNRASSAAELKLNGNNTELVLDHVDFTDTTHSWKSITHSGGENHIVRLVNTDMFFNGTPTPKYTYYLENSVWAITNGYALGAGTARFVLSGKRTRLMPGKRWQGGSVNIDFIIPEGGYDLPPIGCDGETFKSENSFFNSMSGGSIRVMPESPAARVAQTSVYPLFYVYEAEGSKRLTLANVSPTQLPNEESQFLTTDEATVGFAEINDKPEEWWTLLVLSGKMPTVAGLAVKIEGRDVRKPIVTSLGYTGLVGEGLTFELNLASLGERAAGGSATKVIPTLIYRPVGETAWTEVVQSEVSAVGVTTLTAPKSGFSDGKYEIGVRLVNEIGGETEYVAPDTIEISFSKATISELTYVGEGVEATISGTVTGTGSAQTLPAILEISEAEDFSEIAATYQLGSVATGDAIEKTVEVTPGVLTYFRVKVGEGSAAGVATVSGTSRTVATIGEITAVNTNGLCRVAVDGSVVMRGAGVSTVKLRSSMDGIAWQTNVVGTVSEDGSAFSGDCAFPMTSGTAYYEILVENSSGGHTWIAASGVETLPVKDYSTYYWRAVENEWDGDWNDGRHWFKPDLPDDVTLYPQVDTATASFRDCPANEAVAVLLPASVTVKRVESKTAGQKLTLKGAADVTLKAQVRLDQANGQNTFDGLTVEDSASDVKLLGNGCAYALANGAQMSVKSFYSEVETSLTIGEDCVMTIKDVGQERGQKTILVDNGKLIHGGFVGQNSGSGTMTYRLRGKKARVEFTGTGSSLNNNWKNVRFVFEIPEGGYDGVPVQLTNGGGSFLPLSNFGNLLKSAFCTPGDDNGLIFAVAADSPALLKGQDSAIDQDLFVWNTTGFAKGTEYDLIDYTQLQVPARTSAGRKVKHLTMHIRGVDEVKYDSPAALKAAGTTAYAVGCHIDKAPGFVVNVR